MKLYERMTKVQLMGHTIRAWESVESLMPGPNHEITIALRSAVTGQPGDLHVTPEGLAAVLDAMPAVAAYEILDPMGNGCVVYRDWP